MALSAASPALPSSIGLPDTITHWTEVYRDLHAHPELSGQEVRTAAILASELRSAGYEVTENVGGTGVVGVLANGAGPVVALRGDMDGLPIEETTTLPWSSRHTQPGPNGEPVFTMHACGHDMHVTALAAAAEALAATATEWSGTVVIIGQPAEETARGARAMLDDGLFHRFPKPDVVLGQHVGPLPVGMVGHAPGLIMAATCSIDVTIHGLGGHGSSPANTVDPVVIAAYTILRLQTLVSREMTTSDPIVVTVGVVRAGAKSNIIPDSAFFTVNLRARSDETMARTVESVRRIVNAESSAARTPRAPTIVVRESAPATINDAETVDRVMAAHSAALPAAAMTIMPPLMGSEDFSEYGIPGESYAEPPIPYAFWFWGGVDPARFGDGASTALTGGAVPGNHTSDFELMDAPTIEVGRSLLVSAARSFLATGRA